MSPRRRELYERRMDDGWQLAPARPPHICWTVDLHPTVGAASIMFWPGSDLGAPTGAHPVDDSEERKP